MINDIVVHHDTDYTIHRFRSGRRKTFLGDKLTYLVYYEFMAPDRVRMSASVCLHILQFSTHI